MPAQAISIDIDDPITHRITLDSFKVREQVTMTSLNSGGFYGSLLAIDSFLLCTTLRDTMAIHVYSLNTNKKIGEMIRKGPGAGECLSVYAMFKASKNEKNTCWIYDINLKKMLKVDVKKAMEQSSSYVLEEIILTGDKKNLNSPVLLHNTVFAACSYGLPDCRYFYFAMHNDSIRKIGQLPPPKAGWPEDNKKGQFNVLARTFNAKMVARPNGKELALAYKTTDRIDIYRNDSLVNVLRGPDLFDPIKEFISTQGIMMSKEFEKTRFAFVDIKADENYLYVVYSGRDHFAAYGNLVLAFNWEGEPCTQYDMQINITNMAFVKRGKQYKMYAVNGETFELFSGDLPLPKKN